MQRSTEPKSASRPLRSLQWRVQGVQQVNIVSGGGLLLPIGETLQNKGLVTLVKPWLMLLQLSRKGPWESDSAEWEVEKGVL